MNPDERRRKQRALSNTGQQQTQGQYGTGFQQPQYEQARVQQPQYEQGRTANPGADWRNAQQMVPAGGQQPQREYEQARTQQQYGQPQAQPNFSHQQLAGNYGGMTTGRDTRHDVRMFQGQVVGGGQPQQQYGGGQTQQRRYGQTQGFGQGYIAPRRSLGDQHRTAPQRVAASAGRGYNPRTSASLYGGRPRGQARPQQMNQMNAMTRQAVPASSYIRKPYGGTNAVNRQR